MRDKTVSKKLSKELQELRRNIASIGTERITKDDEFSFTNFQWHSSVGIDASLTNSKRCVSSLPSESEYVAKMFRKAGRGGDNKDILIHKTKHCLWKFSDDNSCIEPIFASDVLSIEDIKDDIDTIENEG